MAGSLTLLRCRTQLPPSCEVQTESRKQTNQDQFGGSDSRLGPRGRAAMFAGLLLLVLTCLKWPLNSNDYLYPRRVLLRGLNRDGADDSQVLEIAFCQAQRRSLATLLLSPLLFGTSVSLSLPLHLTLRFSFPSRQ